MPNAPRTPARAVRISDELWNAAKTLAASQGVTMTSVIIEALEKYIADGVDNSSK